MTKDGSSEDTVRVFRMIEYVGPRSQVELQITKSIHGTRHCGLNGCIAITAVTIGEFPEILEKANAREHTPES